MAITMGGLFPYLSAPVLVKIIAVVCVLTKKPLKRSIFHWAYIDRMQYKSYLFIKGRPDPAEVQMPICKRRDFKYDIGNSVSSY